MTKLLAANFRLLRKSLVFRLCALLLVLLVVLICLNQYSYIRDSEAAVPLNKLLLIFPLRQPLCSLLIIAVSSFAGLLQFRRKDIR